MNAPENRIDRWLNRAPWGVGLFALTGFTLTSSADPVPGLPVRIANSVAGIYYLPVTTHYLYQLVARLFVWILPGSDWRALGIFSAIWGAVSICLFYRLMFLTPCYDRQGGIPNDIQRRAKAVAALLGSLFLLIAVPFWSASTRPQYLTFDLALLLTSLSMVLHYRSKQTATPKILFAALFLYGAGVTEYAVMAALSPFFLLLVLYSLWQRGSFSGTTARRALLSGLLGLCVYGLPILAMCQTPDCGYGEFANGQMVLLDLWKKQYHEIKSILPHVGGLLILLSTFGPWCYVLFVKKPKPLVAGYLDGLKTLALLAATGLGACLLLERGFSPAQLSGTNANNILPYLFIASWLGYLSGYWWLRATAPRVFYIPLYIQRLWMLPAILTFLLPPILLVLNYRIVHSSNDRMQAWYAQDVMTSCANHTLIISPGTPFDDLLRWHGRQQNPSPYFIAVDDLDHSSYRAQLHRTFSGILGASTQSVTAIETIRHLANGWTAGPDACAFIEPYMTLAAGFIPVPHGLISTPAADLHSMDPDRLFETNMVLLRNAFAVHIQALRRANRTPLSDFLLTSYSRSANNLGVFLRQAKRDEQARLAFEYALEIFPHNINALLNLRDLCLASSSERERDENRKKAMELLDRAAAISRELGAVAEQPARLAVEYGFLYTQETARRSSRPILRDGFEPRPSHLHLARQALEKSEWETALIHLEQANKARPNDPVILESMLEAYGQAKNASATRQTAQALADADADNAFALLTLASFTDRPEKQEAYLRQAVRDSDHALYGHALNNLAYLLVQQKRYEEAVALAEKAIQTDPSNDKFQHTLAAAYLGLGKLDNAREHLQLAVLRAPRNPNHMVLQAELALAEGRPGEAQKWAREALPQLRDEWRDRAMKIMQTGR